jgi:hypothetical protein
VPASMYKTWQSVNTIPSYIIGLPLRWYDAGEHLLFEVHEKISIEQSLVQVG